LADIRYTKTHEYLKQENGSWFLGISDFAQSSLGDITYVELPESGASFKAGQSICTVESVKAVSDVYAPVDLTITGVNTRLEDKPELVNQSAEGDGWLVSLAPANPADVDALMDSAAYSALEK
jgi:glycine cleavage system H protein